MPENERQRSDSSPIRTQDTEPGVFPPPPQPIRRARSFQIASIIAAFAAAAVGFLGEAELMFWLGCASIALNVLSFVFDGCWVMDTEPGVFPPPPPPWPTMRAFQAWSLLTMLAGVVAGRLEHDETLLVLAVVSFAANVLSLVGEGSRSKPPLWRARRAR
ncbi:MAG: hypothetical protein ACRDHY_12260 [Anaerolineales bacterium]